MDKPADFQLGRLEEQRRRLVAQWEEQEKSRSRLAGEQRKLQEAFDKAQLPIDSFGLHGKADKPLEAVKPLDTRESTGKAVKPLDTRESTGKAVKPLDTKKSIGKADKPLDTSPVSTARASNRKYHASCQTAVENLRIAFRVAREWSEEHSVRQAAIILMNLQLTIMSLELEINRRRQLRASTFPKAADILRDPSHPLFIRACMLSAIESFTVTDRWALQWVDSAWSPSLFGE